MATEASQTNQTETPNPLDMSDEEFLKNPPPVESENTASEQEDPEKDPAEGSDQDPEQDPEQDPNKDPDEDADPKDGGAADRKGGKAEPDAGGKASEGKAKETKQEPSKSTAAGDDKSKSKPQDEGGPGSTDPASTDQPVDYEKAYKDLMTPFKANGREIQVKSIDDIKQLMQMGANYNKKMQALKPNMKILKMLENHGLLDEGKLSFLIDLDKKNPEAISKLVQDSGVNPMEIDEEKAKGYKSGTYSVDDKEVELDTVLGEIEDSPTFQRTLTVVGKEWDQPSRNSIAQHPQLLKLINTHVERGIYDIISTEMASERALGRLTGLSDFEAYRQVGDAINARGGFDHLVSTETQGQQKPPVQKPAAPNPKKEDDKLKDKRRAASTSRPAANPGGATNDFNPLALSDEEFEKMQKKAAHLM